MTRLKSFVLSAVVLGVTGVKAQDLKLEDI